MRAVRRLRAAAAPASWRTRYSALPRASVRHGRPALSPRPSARRSASGAPSSSCRGARQEEHRLVRARACRWKARGRHAVRSAPTATTRIGASAGVLADLAQRGVTIGRRNFDRDDQAAGPHPYPERRLSRGTSSPPGSTATRASSASKAAVSGPELWLAITPPTVARWRIFRGACRSAACRKPAGVPPPQRAIQGSSSRRCATPHRGAPRRQARARTDRRPRPASRTPGPRRVPPARGRVAGAVRPSRASAASRLSGR